MKKLLVILASVVVCFGAAYLFSTKAAEPDSFQTHEYVTIRWSGRENTHLVRASGKVEFLGQLFTKLQRPERVDERAFYMNIAMNALAKEGYEFAGMTHDEIVMKRQISR
jgi:hypothetical protein